MRARAPVGRERDRSRQESETRPWQSRRAKGIGAGHVEQRRAGSVGSNARARAYVDAGAAWTATAVVDLGDDALANEALGGTVCEIARETLRRSRATR